MSNAAQKAKEIREQTSQLQSGEALGNPDKPAEQPVEGQAVPGEGDAPAVPVEVVSNAEDLNTHAVPAEPNPDNSVDFEALYREEAQKRQQTEESYANLRSHTDQVAADNAKLRRDLSILSVGRNEEGNATQIQTPTDLGGEGSGGEQPNVIEITQQRPGESGQEHVVRMTAELEKAQQDYPDIVGPILDALNQTVSNLQNQITPVISTMQEQIVEDRHMQNRNAMADHLRQIDERHPDRQEIVSSDAFGNWLQQHPMQRLYFSTLFPNRQAGEVGGNASEIITILDEFKQASPANQADLAQRQAADQRAAAAQADDNGRIPSSPAAPAVVGEVETITQAQVEEWSKDPVLWRKNKAKVYAAQAAGKIV